MYLVRKILNHTKKAWYPYRCNKVNATWLGHCCWLISTWDSCENYPGTFKEMDLYKIIAQHILGRVLEFLWVCKNYQLVAWPVLAKWISSFSWACLEIGFSSIQITANSWEYYVHIVEVKPCLGEMCLCLSKTCRNLNALNLWIRFDIKGHFVKSNWDFVKKNLMLDHSPFPSSSVQKGL